MAASAPVRVVKASPNSPPRGSVDSAVAANDHSSSPRFEGFRRRFRSSSSSLNANPISPEPPPVIEPDKLSGGKTEALRAAKRFLLSTIRNDWSYSAGEISDTLSGLDKGLREPLDYRVRYDGSSDFESDVPGPRRSKSTNNETDPYRFDSPDAVGTSLAEKKRKKQKLFEEEMTWNEGVRTYAQRRDAWTGAVHHLPDRRRRSGAAIDDHSGRHGSDSTDVSGEGLTSIQESSSAESMNNILPSNQEAGPWLPVFPPLLPNDNPVRSNITPAAYPTIYSKVVIQSLTPTVPIPLTHMTYALIQGWKEEGNWPPQSTAPLVAAPVQDSSKKSTSGLLKFRKNRNNGEKGRMKKGFGVMKKALGGGESHVGGPPTIASSTTPSQAKHPHVDLDFEEQLDAEAADNAELNKGLLEGISTGRHS